MARRHHSSCPCLLLCLRACATDEALLKLSSAKVPQLPTGNSLPLLRRCCNSRYVIAAEPSTASSQLAPYSVPTKAEEVVTASAKAATATALS